MRWTAIKGIGQSAFAATEVCIPCCKADMAESDVDDILVGVTIVDGQRNEGSEWSSKSYELRVGERMNKDINRGLT